MQAMLIYERDSVPIKKEVVLGMFILFGVFSDCLGSFKDSFTCARVQCYFTVTKS